MARKRTPTNVELAGRVNDLEGALDDERKERIHADNEIEENVAGHERRIFETSQSLLELWRRLEWVERVQREQAKPKGGRA